MGAREAAEDWAREAAAAKCSLWMKLTRFNHASQSWEYVRRGKVGRWGGQRRLAQARRREAAGGSFTAGKTETSPARMAYTGAVPPITSGFAKWPPFPAKLDHRGPMHNTLAGIKPMSM